MLYYPWIYLRGGGERLIHELVTASRHDWTLLTNHYDPERTFPEMRELGIVELKRVSIKRSFVPLMRAALTIRTQRLPMAEHDVLVVVCEGFGDLVTFRARRTPTVCVCFTPLKIIHDDAAMARLHAGHSPLIRAAYRGLAPLYRLVEKAAWRHYRSVLAISEEVKRRIVSAGLASPDRVVVAFPGVPMPDFAPVTYEDFFLITGRIMWEKNIELGIDAFRLFRATPGRERYVLTIAGQVDEKSRSYLEALAMRAGDMPVEFIDTPSAEEMQDLYARCLCQLFTAPNEEFGIVVLEAMARKKPVIAVDRGGPAEIIRHEVDGLLVSPEAEEMALAMERIAASSADAVRMGESGYERAATFTWARFAAAVDSGIDAALIHGETDDFRRVRER